MEFDLFKLLQTLNSYIKGVFEKMYLINILVTKYFIIIIRRNINMVRQNILVKS